MSDRRRIFAAALLTALVCRLAFGLAYWRDKPLTRDEREYLELAQHAASGEGLRYPESGADRFSRAPLYPLFVAALVRATGSAHEGFEATPSWLKIAQSVLGVFAVCAIAALAARGAGSRAAVLAAWIAAVYPPLVWTAGYALSEALYIPLALASVIALGQAIHEESHRARSRWTALAGVLCGAAALTRPAHLAFVACACVWLAWQRRILLMAVLLLAALVLIVPWTIRNYREHRRVILIAAEGGVTFWTGNHPLARGEGDLAANPALKLADLEFRRAHPGLSAEQLEPLYYRAAFDWIAAHPVDWAMLVARKFFYVWVPVGPSYRLHSTRYFVASVASYTALLPFAAAGAWRLRRRAAQLRALAIFVVSGVLVALVFMPQERFRTPILDPALIVCAAALAEKSSRVFVRSSRQEG